jgi:hypothetical protein
MDVIQKIKTLYDLSKSEGYSDNEIIEAENNLHIKFPRILREYYLILGKNKTVNESFNKLLNINGEVGFTGDNHYLVFYEENQGAVYWAIDKKDMETDNPKVYGNYDPGNAPGEWFIDSETMDGFLLSMAYWNGALEGLKYTANCSNDDGIENDIIKSVENHWNEIKGITNQQLRFFANDDMEIIVLTTDLENNANGIYTGTSDQSKFVEILEKMKVKWDYRSDEDNE